MPIIDIPGFVVVPPPRKDASRSVVPDGVPADPTAAIGLGVLTYWFQWFPRS